MSTAPAEDPTGGNAHVFVRFAERGEEALDALATDLAWCLAITPSRLRRTGAASPGAASPGASEPLGTGPYASDYEALVHLALAADNCQRLAVMIVKSPAVVRSLNGSPTHNPLVPRYEWAVATCSGSAPSSASRRAAGSG